MSRVESIIKRDLGIFIGHGVEKISLQREGKEEHTALERQRETAMLMVNF